MATVASTRRFDCGMACAQCGDALIAPESSECVSEWHVRHLWCCMKCGYRFETSAYLPADAESIIDIMMMDEVFPSLLVA